MSLRKTKPRSVLIYRFQFENDLTATEIAPRTHGDVAQTTYTAMLKLSPQTEPQFRKLASRLNELKNLGLNGDALRYENDELDAEDQALQILLGLTDDHQFPQLLKKHIADHEQKQKTGIELKPVGVVYYLVSRSGVQIHQKINSATKTWSTADRKLVAEFFSLIDKAINESGEIASKEMPAGRTKNPERDPIMESAYKYAKSDKEVQLCLRCLLDIPESDELTSEQVVDRLLKDDAPLHRLWTAVMTQLNRENGNFRIGLKGTRGEAITRFCDYATCLVLPEEQATLFREQVSKELIEAGTTDRHVILLHFACEWIVSGHHAQRADDGKRIIEQIDNQIIPSQLDRIIGGFQAPPEAGVSRTRNSGYQKDFVRGLAFELGIPGHQDESEAAITALKHAITVKLNDWKGLRGFPIRIVIFIDEARGEDVRKLKKDFPQLFFVKLPKLNHPAYAEIDSRRVDIHQKISSASRNDQSTTNLRSSPPLPRKKSPTSGRMLNGGRFRRRGRRTGRC